MAHPEPWNHGEAVGPRARVGQRGPDGQAPRVGAGALTEGHPLLATRPQEHRAEIALPLPPPDGCGVSGAGTVLAAPTRHHERERWRRVCSRRSWGAAREAQQRALRGLVGWGGARFAFAKVMRRWRSASSCSLHDPCASLASGSPRIRAALRHRRSPRGRMRLLGSGRWCPVPPSEASPVNPHVPPQHGGLADLPDHRFTSLSGSSLASLVLRQLGSRLRRSLGAEPYRT
jgi:hypothetical protein